MSGFSELAQEFGRKPEPWRADARCNLPMFQDVNFYPEGLPRKGGYPVYKAEVDAAKKVCAGCKAKRDCLKSALNNGELEFGIWGGMTPEERRHHLKVESKAARTRRLREELGA